MPDQNDTGGARADYLDSLRAGGNVIPMQRVSKSMS